MRPTKHASALLQCAYKLYSEGRMCDTTLEVEGKSLSAHRIVLIAYSSYFSAVNNADKTITLDGMGLKFDCVTVLVNYMYTGVLEAGECALLDLRKAAQYLEMSSAMQIVDDLEKRSIKLAEIELQEQVEPEAALSSNDEDPGFKEEQDSDYDYEKDIQMSPVQPDVEKKKTRGRRAVTMKRPASRRSSRMSKPAKSPKVQIPKKPRSKPKGRPVKLETETVKTEEKEEAIYVKEEEKEENDDDEEQAQEILAELDQSLETAIEPPDGTEEPFIKAHIVRTAPQPIKQFKQEDGSYKCPEDSCEFMTINDKSFKRHWRHHTGEKPYKCSECNKEFSDLKYIYEHLPTHSDDTPFNCNICQKKFKTKKNLSRHFNNHHKNEVPTYTCVMCNGKFNSKYGLNTHERSVHGVKPSTICDYPGCGYAAPTPSELKKHQVKHIPREQRAKIMCDICGSLFVSPKCLRSHLRFMHYGEPQKCPFCEYTTPAKHLLMGHCARVHKCTLDGVAVEPKFFCNMCDFKCYHKHEYKCHLLKHADDLPHKCTFCSFATHMKGTLVKHLRTHTKERPFSCKLCGKTFTNHSSLAMHNRSHLGIKPHKCKLCDKAFASSSTLKEHMFSHQNISPFMCHICCYGCVRKNILRKHIITKHGSDALPPDMVFKRGYPPLLGDQPEEEQHPAEVKPEDQVPVDQSVSIVLQQQQQQQQQSLPHHSITAPHQQVVAQQPVVMDTTQQQNVLNTNTAIVTTTNTNSFNSAVLAALVNNQPVHATESDRALNVVEVQQNMQQLTGANLNSSQPGANPVTQTIVTMQNVTSPQGHASLDNSTSPHPTTANQMPGQLFGMIRQANQPETTTLAISQSGDALQAPASNQAITPLLPHPQQPIANQPGYAEYPGYLSNSQMSLIQQMYLQTFNTNNMPQQQ